MEREGVGQCVYDWNFAKSTLLRKTLVGKVLRSVKNCI